MTDSPPLPNPRRSPAVALGWLAFVGYGGWVAAMLFGQAERGLLNDVLFLPFYGAAGIAGLLAGRRHRGAPRLARGWHLIGAAWLCSGAGAILWIVYRAVPSPAIDQPAWWVYNLYYPLTLAGMWHFLALPDCPHVRRRLGVEAAIVTVATAVLAWYFVFRFDQARTSAGLLKAVSTLGLGELLIVGGACALLHQPNLATRRSSVLFGLGAFGAAIADFAYEQSRLLGTTWSGPTGDILLALAATLVYTAAAGNARTSEAADDLPGVSVGLALLPYVAVAIVAGLLVYESARANLGNGPIAGLIIAGAVLLGLVVVRVWVAHKEFAREVSARASQDARFRSLVERSADGLAIIDPAGVVRWASPAFGRLVGCPPAAVEGQSLFGFVRDDHHDRLRRWLATPSEQALTGLQFGRAGEWRDIDAVATDLQGEAAVGGMVLNLRDVTERVRLEAALLHAQKMEVVGRLASSVAHDFNNLLTVVLGNLQLVRTSGPDEQRISIEEAEGAARRGVALARQLLSLGRPTAPNPRVGDLNQLVRGLEATLHAVTPRSIVIRVETTSTPLPVTIDEVQLEQMLLNLAINARDAMASQGTLQIRVRRREVDPTGPMAEVTVGDDGAGMSPEVLARASEPFFTTKPVGLGTGLGLATVRRIATELGGRLEIQSRLGRGTTVSILLPLAASSIDRTRALTAPLPGPGDSRHLLVVDDEPAVRRVLARLLAERGYRVTEAADATEALARMSAADPAIDLMLTDVVMPGIRGDELARRVLSEFPETKVLCMSGTPVDSGPSDAPWSSGRILRKPLEIADVTSQIASALRGGGPAAHPN
ncbi:MAG: ATP-binding protein [Gemmatimonadales bacterium]